LTDYREERRRDRAAAAQIRRDDEAAGAKLRATEAKAKLERKATAGRARAARWQALGRWVADRSADLLLAPVIVVGAVLAWTGMAAYGEEEYGTPGLLLPALSEGGMWAFAMATTLTARRHPDRPLWAFRLGTIVFAGYGAALNFLHGDSAGGLAEGIAMALVSVAGVTAHQLVTAGPKLSRQDRERRRLRRAAERRERTAMRAALRDSRVVIGADGSARIVVAEGVATLDRGWLRTRLEIDAGNPAGGAAEPATEAAPEGSPEAPGRPSIAPPHPLTVALTSSPHGTLRMTFARPAAMPSIGPAQRVPEPQVSAPETPSPEPAPAPPKTACETPSPRPRATAPRGRAKSRAKVDALIVAGGMTNAAIAQQAGVSVATVERRKAALREAAEVTNLADRRRA
jgi:hypothetical protein